MGGIIRQIGGVAMSINGMTNHVHLLVRMPTAHSIADIARLVKTNSTRWVHERSTDRRSFAWQTGYGAFTVSESGIVAGQNYISSQREHHKRRSFQEESRMFLQKDKIAMDERYLWD